MLARSPLKTAKDLGLNQSYYEGLLMVLEKMKNREFVWTTVNKPVPNGFNMGRVWWDDTIDDGHTCNTVGCIAGWAGYLTKRRNREDNRNFNEAQSKAWFELVTPVEWEKGKHTLAQAEMALESYLLTGKADWQ